MLGKGAFSRVYLREEAGKQYAWKKVEIDVK